MSNIFRAVYVSIVLHFIIRLVKKTAFSYRYKTIKVPTSGYYVCIGFTHVKTSEVKFVPLIEVEPRWTCDLDILDGALKGAGLYGEKTRVRGNYECRGAYVRSPVDNDKMVGEMPGWSMYEFEQMCRAIEPHVEVKRLLI